VFVGTALNTDEPEIVHVESPFPFLYLGSMKDLDKAFAFPFKDPSWVSKFLLAALFMLLCVVGLGFFILAGYLIQLTQRVMRNEPQPLPEWSDVGVKFLIGFKFVVVYLVYMLPIVVLAIPLAVLSVAGALAGGPLAASVMVGVYAVGYMLLVIPYALLLTMLLPVISYRFALNESIGEALDIGAVLRDFKAQWQNTLIVALIAAGVHSLAGMGIILLFVGVFFTVFYAYCVSAYLHGVLYRASKENAGGG
jgi:hypothetical protein